MAYTTQYIGSRYVPLFAEPAEWNAARTYEPLTIVMHDGNSYTSRQYVPAGIEITNEKFWALTGNYNAQVELYRQEVRNLLPYDETPTEGSTKAVTSDGIKKAIAAETTRATTAEETNATAIADETTRATEAENAITDAYKAADANLSSNLTAAYKEADANLSSNLTAAYKEADANLSSNLTAAYKDALKNVDYMSRADENVVVFSDSTFQTTPDINNGNLLQKSVVSWMQEMCPNMTLTNYGVGGTDIEWLGYRLTELAKNTEDSAKINAATYIVIAYGTNDWQNSVEPLRVNKDMPGTTDGRYDDILTRLQQMAPNANILCVTPAFLKSTSSSNDKILNVNNTGNALYTYNDIMEWVAKKHNVACLRLDQIMGINMSNYQHRMVASTSDIWVHYNQQTNKRIATAILAWMYGACVPSATTKCMDVTPYSWLSGRINQKFYNVGSLDKIPANHFDAEDLLPNHEYWLTFLGGNIKAYVNDILVSNSLNNIGIVQFPIHSDPNGRISLTFKGATETGYPLDVYNMRLTDGRPHIWDALYNNMYATNNYGDRRSFFGNTVIVGQTDIVKATPDPSNSYKVGDIQNGSTLIDGIAVGTMECTINGTYGFYPFIGRISRGGIYWNVPQGWSLTGTIDAQLYYLVLDYSDWHY